MGATRPALALLLAALCVGAACRSAGAPAAGTLVPAGAPLPLDVSTTIPTTIPIPTDLPVVVTESLYGTLALQTAKGAECSAELRAAAPQFGEAPPSALPAQLATSAGIVRWTYAAPRLPGATAYYTVACRSGAASGTATGMFSVDRGPIRASSLTVRVSTDAPSRESFAPVASLVPLRDAALARMRATLANEWKSATRGIGTLSVVEQSADITIFVLAARGTSVHRRAEDGSEDIVVYVEGQLGQKTVENTVATTLHELGHIWCCVGPEADSGGHWKTNVRDSGLYGVDKYGLMTDPVTCVIFGALVSCPNRFSDREMSALGFTSFPPPAPDPCITQAISVRGQYNTTLSQIAVLESQIANGNAQLAAIDAQLKTLRALYPLGAPPNIVAQESALVAQYNGQIAQNNARIDQYNALASRSRSFAAQLNSLPCDPS
jgi:hypothetical protein